MRAEQDQKGAGGIESGVENRQSKIMIADHVEISKTPAKFKELR
jgi:hypothetical protein